MSGTKSRDKTEAPTTLPKKKKKRSPAAPIRLRPAPAQAPAAAPMPATRAAGQPQAQPPQKPTIPDFEARLVRLKTGFASGNAHLELDASFALGGIPDEVLSDLQRAWYRDVGSQLTPKRHLYPWLLERQNARPGYGLPRAIRYLREGFTRNPPMQREFGAVFASPETGEAASIDIERVLTSARWWASRADILSALDRQPKAVIDSIDAGFRNRHRLGFADWLIRTQPRNRVVLRALATLRGDGPEALPVPLATNLIGEGNRNREAAVEILERSPSPEQRAELEQDYNRDFQGVGAKKGETQPDKLRDHLKEIDRAWDSAPYRKAVALLQHNLTLAEKLFFDLPNYLDANAEDAIKLLEECTSAQVSREQLDRDWRRYVQAPGYTRRTLREQIAVMFLGKPTDTKKRLLALYDSLPETDAIAKPAPIEGNAPDVPRRRLFADDQAAERREERIIRSAARQIRAVEGALAGDSWFSDDKVILDHLRRIRETLDQRVGRLEKRIAALRADETIAESERAVLLAYFTPTLERARLRRIELLRSIDDRLQRGDISLGSNVRTLARLAISATASDADEFYVLVMRSEWDAAASLLGKAWARGAIPKLVKDAWAPGRDVNGNILRPGYDPAILSERGAYRLQGRRLVSMLGEKDTDAERGAFRLAVEAQQVTADPDLAPMLSFLTTQGLDPVLRDRAVAEFVAGLDTGAPPSPASANERFLAFLRRRIEAKDQAGTGDTYEKLVNLLTPPKTAGEAVTQARARRAANRKAKLGFVAFLAADAYDYLTGNQSGANADAALETLEALKGMTRGEIDRRKEILGVESDLDLVKAEFGNFTTLFERRKAVEDNAATVIAGAAEVLAESGLSLLTGGAGIFAVIAAVGAGVVGMFANEALSGPNYKLATGDNITASILNAVGTALVECGWRDIVGAKLKVSRIVKALPRDLVQNVATGASERAILSMTEGLGNWIISDKTFSDADLVKHTEMLLGHMVAKVFSTPVTVNFHPGQVNAMTTQARALTNNLRFRLSMKITETLAKETATFLANPNQTGTISDYFLQVLWKEARGYVSTQVKIRATTAAKAIWQYDPEKLKVEEFWEHHPEQARGVVLKQLQAEYHGSKGKALRDEHDEHRIKTGTFESVEQFMLRKFYTEDDSSNALRGRLHKALYAASLEATPPPTTALLTALQVGQEEALRHGRAFAAARAKQIEEEPDVSPSASASERPLPRPAKPQSGFRQFVAKRDQLDEILTRHARQEPGAFPVRASLLPHLFDPANKVRKQLIAGNPGQMAMLLKNYGSWVQLVELLQAGDADALKIAGNLAKFRKDVAARIGGKADPKASSEPGSDLDLAFEGFDPRTGKGPARQLLDAEKSMQAEWGPHWSEILHMNFYTDARNLLRHEHVAPLLTKEDRAHFQVEITRRTELYTCAQMQAVATGLKPEGSAVSLRRLLSAVIDSGVHDKPAFEAFARDVQEAPRRRVRGELARELDATLKAFDEEGRKPSSPEATARRAELARNLTRLQMQFNFFTHEANIAPSANKAILSVGGARMQGADNFQAALSFLTMYAQHRVRPDNERDYEPYKYITRIIAAAAQEASIDVSALKPIEEVARILYSKSGRTLAREDPSVPGNAGMIPKQDLVDALAEFDNALIPVLARLREAAYAQPLGEP